MTSQRTTSSTPALPVFLQWWKEQLKECLPTQLRPHHNETLLQLLPDGTLAPSDTAFQAVRRPKSTFIPQRAPHIILCLPPGSILKRRITLPEAARHNPIMAVHYDLDRLTPFQPNDIVWSLDTTPHAAPPGHIAFDLLIAPQKTFSAAEAQLRASNISPTHIRATSRHDATSYTLPLTTIDQAKRPKKKILLLLAICLLIIVPLIAQRVELWHLDNALSALSTERNHAEALQHSIVLTQLGPQAVQQEEAHNGIPLFTLQNLTDALPDDTYLNSLRLKGRQISLEGQSKEAARLIVTLRQTGHFSDVAFAGPVLRSDNHQADLFSLTATDISRAP